MSWSREFDEPIAFPDGRTLITLRDAASYIMDLPPKEKQLSEWQAAAEAVLLVRRPQMRRVGTEAEIKIMTRRREPAGLVIGYRNEKPKVTKNPAQWPGRIVLAKYNS